MEPDRKTAEQALKEAYLSNPGVWVDHSRYVALACENIARRCADLDSEKAYILERGWEKGCPDLYFPRIYDPGYPHLYWQIRCQRGRLPVHGTVCGCDHSVRRSSGCHRQMEKILEIKKEYFQGKMGCPIYEVLPGVVENSMK